MRAADCLRCLLSIDTRFVAGPVPMDRPGKKNS
jgi:hypothetical protein